ncbi:MAG: class I SAM-dependent methyltransferase [Gemmatimonas sp.]
MHNPLPENLDKRTVDDFGREWARFDQSGTSPDEMHAMFDGYFAVFPWGELPAGAVGFDAGCGTGRWAAMVAPRVGHLHCVDAAQEALGVARWRLASAPNVTLHHASIDAMPFADGSMDFGYSLGVLHHMPDTAGGLAACVAKLKPGAPFLVYLYYAFDNRPAWFRLLWRASDSVRRVLAPLPFGIKSRITDLLALTVYWPLARLAGVLEALGLGVDAFPLSAYRRRSFYSMRTDALDRFGTRLEQRFTRTQIAAMMAAAGLVDIRFSDRVPYWCAVGRRAVGR